MRQLSHPHIVRLFEVIETTSHIYVVMEYMNSGELFYYITEKGRLNEDEARHFFQQVRSVAVMENSSHYSFSICLYVILFRHVLLTKQACTLNSLSFCTSWLV